MGEAVGFVETRGLAAAIEAIDAMAKTANVRVLKLKKIGSGLISVTVAGEVAAVQSAVVAGEAGAALVGEIISVNVIPMPDKGLHRALGLNKASKNEHTQIT